MMVESAPDKHLEAIVLEDELLDDIKKAERDGAKRNQDNNYEKPKFLDAVQYRIEKAVLDSCIERKAFQPYGVVMDALAYIHDGHRLDGGFFMSAQAAARFREKSREEIKSRIISVAKVIEDAFLKAVSDLSLNNEDAKNVLDHILRRYDRRCNPVRKGELSAAQETAAKAVSAEAHPYNADWDPCFKELSARLSEYALPFIENVIVWHCLDTKLRDYELFKGCPQKGLLSYGVVVDAMGIATGKIQTPEYLPEYAKKKNFEADVLAKGRWRRISSPAPAKENLQRLEAEIGALAAKIKNSLKSGCSELGMSESQLMNAAKKLKWRFMMRGCYAEKEDRFGTISYQPLQPYEIPWKPIFKASIEKLKVAGITFNE